MYMPVQLSVRVKLALLLILSLIAVQPLLLIAQQQQAAAQPGPLDRLTASGDSYLSSVSHAALLSVQLVPALATIQATPPEQLTEAAIMHVRSSALELARQSAIALGAVDDLATNVDDISPSSPDAVDLVQEANAGLPADMRQYLRQEAGLATSQVDQIEDSWQAGTAARVASATNGLSADLRTQLGGLGFSETEINQIDTAVRGRGVANLQATTSMAQFQGSQDDLAAIRTSALVLATQMLGQQIGVRQLNGSASRAVTDAELQALVNDELRVLLHAKQINTLWGNDPRLDIGEGHWWFLERYAQRATERLATLTVESQNRGLVVELLLLEQIQTLSLTARSGDAAYVKEELDRLVVLLEQELAARGPTVGAGGTASTESSGATDRRVRLVQNARLRLASAAMLTTAATGGAFEELDETNNRMGILIAVGLPDLGELAEEHLLAVIDILSQVTTDDVLTWIRAILTGETDDPALIAGNILFSLIPVLGVIPDLYSIVTDPSIFVKALSLIGIIGSIGDLIALFPPAAPIAGASFLGDASAAVLKALFRQADNVFKGVLDALSLRQAFDIAVDVVSRVVDDLVALGKNLGDSIESALAAVREMLEGGARLWSSFVGFAKRVGVSGLTRLGFSKGGRFAGHVLSLGTTLSDEALEGVVHIGDDLAVSLSDEAAVGLGKVTDDVGEDGARRFLDQTGCLVSSVAPRARTAGLAAPLANADPACDLAKQAALEILGDPTIVLSNLSDDALAGLTNIIKLGTKEEAANFIKRIASKYPNNPEYAAKALTVLRKTSTKWSAEAMDGVTTMLHHLGGDDLKVLRVLQGTSGAKLGEKFFGTIKKGEDAFAQQGWWPGFVRHAGAVGENGGKGNLLGASHVLFYIDDTLGFNQVSELEKFIKRNNIERYYDIVGTNGKLYEMKNIRVMEYDYYKQLTNDLQILNDQELQNLSWVLRGTEGQGIPTAQSILDGLRSHINGRGDLTQSVKDTLLERLDDNLFGTNNIKFTGGGFPYPDLDAGVTP